MQSSGINKALIVLKNKQSVNRVIFVLIPVSCALVELLGSPLALLQLQLKRVKPRVVWDSPLCLEVVLLTETTAQLFKRSLS